MQWVASGPPPPFCQVRKWCWWWWWQHCMWILREHNLSLAGANEGGGGGGDGIECKVWRGTTSVSQLQMREVVMEVAASTTHIKINNLIDRSWLMFCHFQNAMWLALAALEAYLQDERWVGMGWSHGKGEGRMHLQMSRCTGVGYCLQVKLHIGLWQTYTAWQGWEYYLMSCKIITVSRTPNTCQILGSLGKNKPEPARQPYRAPNVPPAALVLWSPVARPQKDCKLDRTRTAKNRTSSPIFWILRF